MQLSAILALRASKPATGCLKTVQLSLILALGGPWGFVLPPAHGATQSRIPWGCDSPALKSKAPLDRGVGGRNPKP